jgi:DNA-binding GntR family transcriptional regulator
VPDSNPDLLSPGLAAEIATRLEAQIVTLALHPGAWVREEELAARYGVSRSPVREAMRLVEADGLLRRFPRRGSQVAAMGREDLDALCACRLPLEGLAAAGAARFATRAMIDQQGAALAAMRAAVAAGDVLGAFQANVAITDTLHAHCGNPVLRRLLLGLDKLARRFRYCSYRDLPGVMAGAVAANEALLAAITRHDADAAQAITETLIRHNWTALAAWCDRSPGPAA